LAGKKKISGGSGLQGDMSGIKSDQASGSGNARKKPRPDGKKSSMRKMPFVKNKAADLPVKGVTETATDPDQQLPVPAGKAKSSVKTRATGERKEIAKKENKKTEVVKADPESLERGDKPMSVIGHLSELRSRLLMSLISVVVLTITGFIFSDQLFDFITKPYLASGQKLNQFNIMEGFTLRIKASFFTALLIGIPLIVYQVGKYISPAIDKADRRFIWIILSSAVLLFYTGVALTYMFLPMAIAALLSFTPESVATTINATQYLSFVIFFSVSMGAIFELPIVILILTKMGIVTPAFLISKRKHAFVLLWIIAAVVTPTQDPLTQAMVAVPLMILFEVSIIISKFVTIRKKKREEQDL
jgi:sec-independent protein translocase protein TatC